MQLQDVPSPKPRLLKRPYNNGKEAAENHCRLFGSRYAKGCFTQSASRLTKVTDRVVLSYWSGYRAGLESYREQEATDEV